MKNWIIKKLGGYPALSDAVEAIQDRSDRHLMLTEAVKKLFNTISEEDILKEVKGKWFFLDKELPEAEKGELISEAVTLLNSKLWKILKADVQYQANKKMYILSRDDFDLVMGKSWTYVFDCLATRLKSMEKGFGKYNTG